MSIYISEIEWKTALIHILVELDEQEYKKMLMCRCFHDIPKSTKNMPKDEMPQLIIQHFGVHKSISAINEAMIFIPRNDPKVQDLLRPFVDNLMKIREEKNKGEKRKHECDSKSADKKPESKTGCKRNRVLSDDSSDEEEEKVAAGRKRKHERDSKSADKKPESKTGFEKNNVVSDDSSDEEEKVAADPPKNSQPVKERKIVPWTKSIKDLLTSGDLGGKNISGKVVQKSALRTYQTKQKKKENKVFFYLGFTDDTSCIKVMVYGKDRYQGFKEGSFYSIREVIMEENLMKITKRSSTAKTSPFDIPEELEMEAQMLIYPQTPVCCIAKAKVYADRTAVSVEGTVTEIGRVAPVKVKNQRRTKDKQDFRLKDDTDSVRVTLWGKDIAQLRGISAGDTVRVTNVKTNQYFESVSLNSTDFTRIVKIQSAANQNIRIEIIGIKRATKMETELEAGFGEQVETFVVASQCLAKAFGVRLGGDFEDKLLEKIPFSANVEIQGSKINTITAAAEI